MAITMSDFNMVPNFSYKPEIPINQMSSFRLASCNRGGLAVTSYILSRIPSPPQQCLEPANINSAYLHHERFLHLLRGL